MTTSSTATLAIMPGVVVKFNGSTRTLTINGSSTLRAEGNSQNRITFTSIQDDAADGVDSGGDGSTSGAPGQWRFIWMKSGAQNAARVSYADIRYGGGATDGIPCYQEGPVYITKGVPNIEHSTVTYNKNSGIYVLGNSTGDVGAIINNTEISHNNRAGLYVGQAWVSVSNRSLISNNTCRGIQFSLSSTYIGPASTIMETDITENGSDGILALVDNNVPDSKFPHGNRNNIFENAEKQINMYLYYRPGVDWKNNFWGENVDYYYNPPDCWTTTPYSVGFLAYSNSISSPPDGPINRKVYAGSSSICYYDRLKIGADEFSRTYIDGDSGPTLGQTYGAGEGGGGGTDANNPTGSQQDPVNSLTGSFYNSRTDFVLPGIGLPFALTRHYNSQDLSKGPLGQGWRHNFGASLDVESDGDVTLWGEDGQRVFYDKQSDGTFLPPPGGLSQLSDVSGDYELLRKNQVRYRFNSGGRLLNMKDRNNNQLTFTYNGSNQLTRITDTVSRDVEMTYDATSKLLTRATLPDGRYVAYTYTNGLLTSVRDTRGGTTSYEYDTRNWLKKETDPNNNQVFLNTYNAYGRVTEQRDGLNNLTTFSWDGGTQTSTATDARGNQWKDVYSNGKLARRVDPLTNDVSITWDANFNPTAVTDRRGNTSSMTYDAQGNILFSTAPAPLSYQQVFTYDSMNNLLTARDGRGNTTSYSYDTGGNLVTSTQSGDVTTTYSRDPGGTGLLAAITDARGVTTDFEYDSLGNMTAVVFPGGGLETMTYDASGRLTSRVEPRGNVQGASPDDFRTTFTYDDANNIVSVIDPLGNTNSMTYDAAGRMSAKTDANGYIVSYGYDTANHLKAVTADGAATSYNFDAVGNLTSRVDANAHTTSYSFDPANRLTGITSPLGRQWTYQYDPNGNITRVIDANGNSTTEDASDGVTEMTYDALNRPVDIDYAGSTPSVSLAYDANSNRIAMTDDAGAQSYSYDALNRLLQVARGSSSFNYGYDQIGNITQSVYPDNTEVDYGYDPDGLLTNVTADAGATAYQYDVSGNLTETTLPSGNGYTEERTYDNAGRLTGLVNARTGATLSYSTYAYDPAGNPTTMTSDSGTTYFEYDGQDRVTEACYGSTCDSFVRYSYDDVGNRLTEVRPAGTTSYSYNAGDQLTEKSTSTDDVTYAYDSNGNQTRAGSRDFAYDLANRLIATTEDSQAITYSYDGDGVRLEASNGSGPEDMTKYLWDANAALPILVRESNGSGDALRRYTYGNDLISMESGGQDYFYHYDGIGSVVNLTSVTGDVQWSYAYDPFGEMRIETQNNPAAPANLMRFTGELFDQDTGLYHLRARQYDPANGRFTAIDPVGPYIGDPYVASYVYARNAPGVYTDPSGQVVDIILDVGFIGWDLYTVGRSYFTDDGYMKENLTALGLDIAGAAIPFATGLGMVSRGGKAAKALRGTKSVKFGFKTTRDWGYITAHLKQHHGIDPMLASERLHLIKQRARLNENADVVFDRTGNVYDPRNGEWIGSLTQGGAR